MTSSTAAFLSTYPDDVVRKLLQLVQPYCTKHEITLHNIDKHSRDLGIRQNDLIQKLPNLLKSKAFLLSYLRIQMVLIDARTLQSSQVQCIEIPFHSHTEGGDPLGDKSPWYRSICEKYCVLQMYVIKPKSTKRCPLYELKRSDFVTRPIVYGLMDQKSMAESKKKNMDPCILDIPVAKIEYFAPKKHMYVFNWFRRLIHYVSSRFVNDVVHTSCTQFHDIVSNEHVTQILEKIIDTGLQTREIYNDFDTTNIRDFIIRYMHTTDVNTAISKMILFITVNYVYPIQYAMLYGKFWFLNEINLIHTIHDRKGLPTPITHDEFKMIWIRFIGSITTRFLNSITSDEYLFDSMNKCTNSASDIVRACKMHTYDITNGDMVCRSSIFDTFDEYQHYYDHIKVPFYYEWIHNIKQTQNGIRQRLAHHRDIETQLKSSNRRFIMIKPQSSSSPPPPYVVRPKLDMDTLAKDFGFKNVDESVLHLVYVPYFGDDDDDGKNDDTQKKYISTPFKHTRVDIINHEPVFWIIPSNDSLRGGATLNSVVGIGCITGQIFRRHGRDVHQTSERVVSENNNGTHLVLIGSQNL